MARFNELYKVVREDRASPQAAVMEMEGVTGVLQSEVWWWHWRYRGVRTEQRRCRYRVSSSGGIIC